MRSSKTLHFWFLRTANAELDIDGSGVVVDRYIRGIGLIKSDLYGYYAYNGHGDVVQLTNGSGVVTKDYQYDAFGVEENIDQNDQNPWRYCGEYYDVETEMYYLRARYYNPRTSRMLSPDTNWHPGNMIYGDNPRKINERTDALGLNVYTYVPDINAIIQSSNLYIYCGNNPLKFIDPTGFSYENSIKDLGGGVYEVTTTWLGSVTTTYEIDNGVIRFDFAENNYWGVLWRGGGKDLAEGMYHAAKSIDSNYLSGRTIGGINTEMQIHYAAYTVTPGWVTTPSGRSIKEAAQVADMGGTDKNKIGYDSNAWVFEGGNAAKVAAKLNPLNPVGTFRLIQDFLRYL